MPCLVREEPRQQRAPSRNAAHPFRLALGPLAGTRSLASLSSSLSSKNLASLVGLWGRHSRGHGLSLHRSRLLGAQTRTSNHNRNGGTADPSRNHPGMVDRALSIPRSRRLATRSPHLV